MNWELKTSNKKMGARKIVSPCYDHLGGKLGEALFQVLVKERWIQKVVGGREYAITEEGWQGLATLGIDMEKIRTTKRKVVSPCVERRSGDFYDHTGAYLGALLRERLFTLGWLVEVEEERYEITEKGLKGLESLGVDLKALTG